MQLAPAAAVRADARGLAGTSTAYRQREASCHRRDA